MLDILSIKKFYTSIYLIYKVCKLEIKLKLNNIKQFNIYY